MFYPGFSSGMITDMEPLDNLVSFITNSNKKIRRICFTVCILKMVILSGVVGTAADRPWIASGHMQPLGTQGAPYQQVEELMFAPCGKDFYSQYVRTSKPVVIRGAVKRWPAFKNLKRIQYLRDIYGDEPFNVEFRKKFKNVFPLRKTIKLSNFLDEYQEKDIYLDSLFPRDSKLSKEMYIPFNLHCKKLSNGIDNLNLLMSSGNTSSAFHHDGYENLLSVISGVKEVILYDSKYTQMLDGDNFSLASGVSQIDPERVDLKQYPAMARLPYQYTKLSPGDMLYIPQYWWHQVRSYGNPNIAIAIWFSVFNFGQEFDKRNIDEMRQVIKTTEIFRELQQNEPKEIDCKDNAKLKRSKFYATTEFSRLIHRKNYSCKG